jgi:Uma2 family endonuclease
VSHQPVQTLNPPARSLRLTDGSSGGLPPLNPGDRLSRAEFERRYEAHHEIKKAELIKGVVYIMPSPFRIEQHSSPHSAVVGWLVVYAAHTPGVRVGDNGTVRLEGDNEPQPDAFLRLDPAHGGKSRISEDDYLEGPPELIVEVAASSVSYDLHDKRQMYQDSGVQEYVAVQVYEQRVDWFVLRESVYQPLTPDEAGVLRSEVFPGLWLQPAALWSGDLASLLATLQQGLASPEHAAYVERLVNEPSILD